MTHVQDRSSTGKGPEGRANPTLPIHPPVVYPKPAALPRAIINPNQPEHECVFFRLIYWRQSLKRVLHFIWNM